MLKKKTWPHKKYDVFIEIEYSEIALFGLNNFTNMGNNSSWKYLKCMDVRFSSVNVMTKDPFVTIEQNMMWQDKSCSMAVIGVKR